ncbi:MAG: hypothetical protein V3U76_00300 [Granulosicoccus sp.]
MNTPYQRIPLLLGLVALVALTACGQDVNDQQSPKTLPLDKAVLANSNDVNSDEIPDMMESDSTLSAIIGASDIPYPVYPNGNKYRVGGENGLKIVVFQTEDTFAQVDAYYTAYYSSDETAMPRLVAMKDYVRYSTDTEDKDPWATYRAGIVIHEFNNKNERYAVGAKDSAQTNIIMSF